MTSRRGPLRQRARGPRHVCDLRPERMHGGALDADVSDALVEPVRKPPRDPTQHLEHRREQDAADRERIEEDREAHAEAELLDRAHIAQHERDEHAPIIIRPASAADAARRSATSSDER